MKNDAELQKHALHSFTLCVTMLLSSFEFSNKYVVSWAARLDGLKVSVMLRRNLFH